MGSFNGNVFITYNQQNNVSDIEYLVTQEFNNNIIRLQDVINQVEGKLTHSVNPGKDAYILIAKIIPAGFTQAAGSQSGNRLNTANNHTEAKISSGPRTALVELDRVTVGMGTTTRAVRGTTNGIGEGTGGSGYGSMTDGIFHAAIGAKATAGQRIEIENTLANGNCRAQLVLLEVDAGASPRI